MASCTRGQEREEFQHQPEYCSKYKGKPVHSTLTLGRLVRTTCLRVLKMYFYFKNSNDFTKKVKNIFKSIANENSTLYMEKHLFSFLIKELKCNFAGHKHTWKRASAKERTFTEKSISKKYLTVLSVKYMSQLSNRSLTLRDLESGKQCCAMSSSVFEPNRLMSREWYSFTTGMNSHEQQGHFPGRFKYLLVSLSFLY